MICYHVTPIQNIPSIQTHGLVPAIGPLSRCKQEQTPGIYLFTTMTDMEDAITNWLGDALEEQYGDDCNIAILHIDLPDSIFIERSSVEYECICREIIPVKYITFYDDSGNRISTN